MLPVGSRAPKARNAWENAHEIAKSQAQLPPYPSVPKYRSPASPSPGTMYFCASSPRSTAAR